MLKLIAAALLAVSAVAFAPTGNSPAAPCCSDCKCKSECCKDKCKCKDCAKCCPGGKCTGGDCCK